MTRLDYRGVITVTSKNRHPVSLITKTMDRLCGVNVLFKMSAFRLLLVEGPLSARALATSNAPIITYTYVNRVLLGLVANTPAAREFQLFASSKKCQFATYEVEIWGYIVSTAGRTSASGNSK